MRTAVEETRRDEKEERALGEWVGERQLKRAIHTLEDPCSNLASAGKMGMGTI